MLHQDASRRAWLPAGPPGDLVVTIDKATNEIYSALLVEEENTASTGLRATVEHGIGVINRVFGFAKVRYPGWRCSWKCRTVNL